MLDQPCPDFETTDVAGQAIRNQDFLGSWLLLVFHRHLA